MPRGAAAVALGRLDARTANGGENDLPCRYRFRSGVRGDVDQGVPDIRDERSPKRFVVLLGGLKYLVVDAVHDRFGEPKRPLCGGEDDIEDSPRTRANQLVVEIGVPLLVGGVKMHKVGMQVRIRTNSLEFEFALNSHEFVDPSEFEFATSKLNSPRMRLNLPTPENPYANLKFTYHVSMYLFA